MSISRRQFLETTALGALAAGPLAADVNTPLPTRVLGKTGAKVSILAMGGGSKFLTYKEEPEALEAAKRALDLGITYIDTCDDYGKNHLSEKRLGQVIKGRRDGLFLATKITPRDASAAQKNFEESLKSLQVEQVDLLHIHALKDEDDLAAIEAKGGVLELLMKLKEQKLTRFVGITCHAAPTALQKALERHDFDCTQMALNAGMVAMMNGAPGTGMVPNPAVHIGFENTALPVAMRKKMGILAMKVFAQDHLEGQATPEKLMYYSLSLPVTAVVIGMPKLSHIDENVRLAKAFKPLPKSEMKELSEKLSLKNKQALDRFFRDHVDA